jgi:hypothetical protein
VAFNVGDKAMPPGEYVFRNGGGINASTCTVSGTTRNEALVQCHMAKVDGVTKETEASFTKAGDKLYLSAIKFASHHDKNQTYQFTIEPSSNQAAAEKK